MVGLILVYVIHSWMIGYFIKSELKLRKLRSRLLSGYCKLGLRVLGVEVDFSPDLLSKFESEGRNFLVVSNHLSYVDVLVMSSLFPAVFVTSIEVLKTPVLGELCILGGSLFVERRSREKTHLEVNSLANALRAGLNVVVFPEATTSSGEFVRPFKASMFDAAVQAQVEVLPLCIHLVSVNGGKVTPEYRDSVCYYGDMEFSSHFLRLLRLKRLKIRLKVMEPIRGTDLRELRDSSFQLISEAHSVLELHELVS